MHSIPRTRAARKPTPQPRCYTCWQFLDRLFAEPPRYTRLILLILLLDYLDQPGSLTELLRHTAALH